MSKHTHICRICKHHFDCDMTRCLLNSKEPWDCLPCRERAPITPADAEVYAFARREIIASLVPHVAAGICAATVAKDWMEEDTARAIFVQAERIYQEGVRRSIYPGKESKDNG